MQGRAYRKIHEWINVVFPRVGRCEFCGRTDRRTEYASISHTYLQSRDGWFELCHPCHMAFDGNDIGQRKREKSHCPHGHVLDFANTYRKPDGSRECRICKRAGVRRWKRAQRPVAA